MQAELLICGLTNTDRFVLSKGSHGIRGLDSRRPTLVSATSEHPIPELILEWDPVVRNLMWRKMGAPRSSSQALRSGEAHPIGEFVFSFELTWAPPKINGTPAEEFQLEPDKTYQFGRASEEAAGVQITRIQLDPEDRTISKIHANLSLETDGWILSDHSSTETLLNGEPFTRSALIYGDRFRIGDYVFEFRGAKIERVDHSNAGRIDASNLAVVVKDRQTGKPFRILNDVDLRIETGNFIGVLGGSGSGKSTLLNALCGIRPANQGEVSIGGIENSLLNRLRPGAIGYVPQDDIVHPELVVSDAFYLAARLRLRLKDRQRQALVERTIDLLGLTPHCEKRVCHLSGGQRKRVSIGIELLSKPAVLFLDEPSSGLDPATEESLMELLQSLTLTNLTVVCTTHVLQKAYLFDRLVFVHGGRIIFEGNSSQAREFFGKRSLDSNESLSESRSPSGAVKSPLEKIYSEVLRGTKSAAEWESEFKDWKGQLKRSFSSTSKDGTTHPKVKPGKNRVPASSRFFTLWVRQWKILCADWLNLAFLFSQVVLISLLIAFVSDEFGFRMFLGLIATMWFGCSNGAQQIVSELPVVKREQICGLGRNVYLSSKFAFQGFISCLQGLILFLIVIPMGAIIHPIDLDEDTFKDLYEMRLEEESGAPPDPEHEKFVPMTLESDHFLSDPDKAQPEPAAQTKPTLWQRVTAAPPTWLALTVAKWFVMKESLTEPGKRVVGSAQDTTTLVAATSPWEVIIVGVIFKLGAFFGAALVGVSLGLAVSAWVRTPTQAVMWVPLLLIPQILFGGYVVTLAKMSPPVRAVARLFPSQSCQRIIDVSNLYGRATPLTTNLTKFPVFLSSGEPETISWDGPGGKLSQSFDRESYVNTSWQNLAVIAERVGQHKKVTELAGVDANGSDIVRSRDSVKTRNDVRYSNGTPFLFIYPAVVALWILVAWNCFCYGIAWMGVYQKTSR